MSDIKNLMFVVDTPESVTITNADENEKQSKILTMLNQSKKVLTEIYAPQKSAASAAHKTIVAEEKKMLEPITKYIDMIKKAMSDYLMALEQENAKKEAEAQKKLDALNKELGSGEDNPFAGLNVQITPTVEVQKEDNISIIEDWDVEVVNLAKVPVTVDGKIVRDVNLGTIKKIVKEHKGDIKIAGIKITPKKQIRARA